MNGVVVIDKPAGITSHATVQAVRRILKIKKAGHAGTLDPTATGVLPVCLNEATKLVQFFAQDIKEYRATMLLGVKTDTLDLEGQVIARQEPLVNRQDIEAALQQMIGRIEQIPPKYSALKYQGKPLHRWARRGVDIEPAPRMAEIYGITLEETALPYATFSVSCAGGTYIRSLCADAGERLGCGACLAALHRTRSGLFRQEEAIALATLNKTGQQETLGAGVISMVDALPHITTILIDQETAGRLRSGFLPDGELLRGVDIPFIHSGDMVKFINGESSLVAVAKALYGSGEIRSLPDRTQAMKIMRVFAE